MDRLTARVSSVPFQMVEIDGDTNYDTPTAKGSVSKHEDGELRFFINGVRKERKRCIGYLALW